MKKGDQLKLYNPQALQKIFASQEAQAYTMAFLSFFSLAFFTVFAIRPTLTSFFNLRKQIDDARMVNTQLDTKINSLLAAQQTYQDYQSEIPLLSQALPEGPQFAQIIQKLESIVNVHEATTTAFATNQEVILLDKNTPLNTIPVSSDTETGSETASAAIADMPVESVSFNLSILSSFQNNESIVATILNLKRMLSLSLLEFAVSSKEDTGPAPEIDTTMNAEAYFLPKEDVK